MTILDLNIFQYSPVDEVINQGSSKFWTSLLGALIGSATALTVYFLTTRRDRRNERRRSNLDLENALTYFTCLLKTIVEFGDKQHPAYLEHSNNIKAKPLDIHRLKLVIAEDLERACNKLSQERLYHAYINRFGNNEERIRKFQKMFSAIDFMRKLYEMASESQVKFESELIKMLNEYRDIAQEETLAYCGNLANIIKQTNPDYEVNDFWNLLNTKVYEFHRTDEPKTIERLQTKFIIPVRNAIIERHRHIPEAMYIADNCRKATWLYSERIEISKNNAEEFKEYSDKLKDTNDKLKELISDL